MYWFIHLFTVIIIWLIHLLLVDGTEFYHSVFVVYYISFAAINGESLTTVTILMFSLKWRLCFIDLYWIFKPHVRPRLGWSIFYMANIWSFKTTPMLPCADPGGYRAAQCAHNHLHGGVWQKIGLWMNMIDIEPDRDILYGEIPQSWGYPSQKLTVCPWK